MMEGEWMLELACARSNLVYKAGTKPSILEMIEIFDIGSFEYGSDQENRRRLEVYLRALDRKNQIKKLKDGINFLNHNDQYVCSKLETVIEVDYLIDWFIYSLHKRMPKMCGECDDWYHAEIGKEYKLRCMICNIGNHGCRENHVKNWVCGECAGGLRAEDHELLAWTRENVMLRSLLVRSRHTENPERNQSKKHTKDMLNLGGKSDAQECQTREGFTKSQLRKQREAWKNRLDQNENIEDDDEDEEDEDFNEETKTIANEIVDELIEEVVGSEEKKSSTMYFTPVKDLNKSIYYPTNESGYLSEPEITI